MQLDGSLFSTFLSVNSTILVGVLVFSSVLELVGAQDSRKFSLDERYLEKQVRFVVRFVQYVVYFATLGAIIAIVGVMYPAYWLAITGVVATALGILLFAVLATLTIHRLWLRN